MKSESEYLVKYFSIVCDIDYGSLPFEYQFFEIQMSTGGKFSVTYEEKEKIMRSSKKFFQLKSGEVINKSFLTVITFDFERISHSLRELPDEKKAEIFITCGKPTQRVLSPSEESFAKSIKSAYERDFGKKLEISALKKHDIQE